MTSTANTDTSHQHGSHCGHVTVRHGDHVDYVQDGHLHHPEGDRVEEHVIEVSERNPIRCTPGVRCDGHNHGPGCGHEAVPHGDPLTTSWTLVSTIHTANIAMTTGPCR